MRGDFCIGVDLGQSNDYTALAIVEKLHSGNLQKLTALHLRHLERYPLLTPYPDIAAKVVALAKSEYLVTYTTDEMLNRITLYPELVVDQTGVRVAVTDLLKERGLKFTAVTIHGRERVTRSKGAYNVPKLDLVAALEVPFHTETLKVAEGLELWGALREELQSFRRKVNTKTAYTSFEHWRVTDHDDLILGALDCW